MSKLDKSGFNTNVYIEENLSEQDVDQIWEGLRNDGYKINEDSAMRSPDLSEYPGIEIGDYELKFSSDLKEAAAKAIDTVIMGLGNVMLPAYRKEFDEESDTYNIIAFGEDEYENLQDLMKDLEE